MLAMPQQDYIKFLYEKKDCNITEISDKVGINWRTAAKYAKKEDWNRDFAKSARKRPVIDSVAEIIDIWLLEDGLKPRKDRRSATAIYHQLVKEYSFSGSDRTIRGYVSQRKQELLSSNTEKFLKLDHPPGRAQVDFGRIRVIWDGQIREIMCLMCSFPYSNVAFAYPLPAENTVCFLHGLTQIFSWLKGVPPEIWFDNLTAAVVSIGKGEERTLTEMFTRFKLHYRFEAHFCNGGKGNEKGHIENKIGYVRRNWVLPYPEVTSFEELADELYHRAIEDLNRSHYQKESRLEELWEADKQVLLALPAIPFEPAQTDTARVDKYCRIRCQKEEYNLPQAKKGETVYLRMWWDHIDVYSSSYKPLATFPRNYTFKEQPIDWKSYFVIFVKKPRGAKNASMYKHLPPDVKTYLDHHQFKERLRFIHSLLQEGFTIEQIAQALKHNHCDEGIIRHYLYRLAFPDKPLELLNEAYTPASVRNYSPQVNIYDRLLPLRGGVKNDSKGAVQIP